MGSTLSSFKFFIAFLLAFSLTKSYSQDTIAQKTDSIRLVYPIKDQPFLNLYPNKSGIELKLPSNIKREIEFDTKSGKYVIQDRLGNKLYRPPLILSIEEYKKYEERQLKRDRWMMFSDLFSAEARSRNLLPNLDIQNKAFQKIFGGSEISITPRGSADVSLLGRHNKNENPLFNERQRNQYSFDFNQRIQMSLTGKIGERLKLKANYNTESQFDFENEMKMEHVGKDDDIIQKIEIGNVSLPLNSSLISGSQSLFGIKTHLQFGKVHLTSVLSQHKSQQKEITISNGAQQNEFNFSADNYEANKHYFLSHYFRDNYNRALSTAPVLQSSVHITQIEVWITNKSNTIDNARDILAFMDLGEYNPYNSTIITSGNSMLPAAASLNDPSYPQQSNNLLSVLPAQARYTNSNDIQSFFRSSGGGDNFAKLTYARKLTEREFSFDPKLGYISLNMPLNADQVLAVSYRYTANGQEYQVGDFSTDIPVDPSNPQVLYAKLLKNETLKPNLPVWDLMMKNIYAIGAYRIGRSNFVFNIYRTENESGVDRPIAYEGAALTNKLWLQVMGLDRLNAQNNRQSDGVFDFLENITIDSEQGRVRFPFIEPFGKDLAKQFNPVTETHLIEKYTFQALYDSTKVIAQQLFPGQNRYLMKGTYESESGAEFQLDAVNVPRGSVQVYSGSIPLKPGIDYSIDYEFGRIRILNEAILNSGQPIRIKMENDDLFGLQQKTMVGTRLDYLVNDNLHFGATYLNLTEKPLTQKVNLAEEPISNSMYGFDMNYNSSSRWLTRMVDRIPFISTSAPSSISFFGEFAALKPGHPRALNVAGNKGGVSYIDDFENSQSVIDLKGAINWQISGTPQYFPESALEDDLRYGYNRARLAFYNIDPLFYRNNRLTPNNIKDNKEELSLHSVREVREQEVFPYKESSTGEPLFLSTLDLSFYPTRRGPYNYTTTGLTTDGSLTNPKSRWGGILRKIETPDFESQNIEFIELWMMDPFLDKPNSDGGSIYFNLGNISEDILKDGKKSLENGIPTNGDYSQMETTVWGRVPKNQPIIQAFDNDPAKRALQDVGLDGLADEDERIHFDSFLNQLSPQVRSRVQNDPSNDNFEYFLGTAWDSSSAGILKRYENYNGTENNSRTSQQAQQELGIDNAASTLLPDGEDINRDNNMNQNDEYYQYKVSLKPSEMEVGQNFIVDKHTAKVRLANGKNADVKWYQFRIPIRQFQDRVGDVQDFKSIRFVRMFLTDFADTTVLRLAKLELVRGEWRKYNSEGSISKVIADPSLISPAPDNSEIEIAAVSIEKNGNRQPIPYVVPPGIERQVDYVNAYNNVQLNEQALSFDIKNLRDGYGRGTYRTSTIDFRTHRNLEMFVHAEGVDLKDKDLNAFIRFGTDGADNYYEYELPLNVTRPGTKDTELIWPEQNRFDVRLELFQIAKDERNQAMFNGQPWPIEMPFTISDERGSVTIKGQPELSKVRFYMLGVKNPLRNVNDPSNDDGLDKSGIIWFNELRLSGFESKGGWAGNTRISAQLADFADIALSASKSTIGFGSIDKRVGERSRDEEQFINLTSSVELGKFFPEHMGLRIPVYFNYSNQLRTPEYNPLVPDILMQTSLQNLTPPDRDSLLHLTQDVTTRRSINFTNVRKLKMNADKPNRLWDVENWNASFAFSEYYHRDFLTQKNSQKTYRGALDYNYSNSSDHFFQPLKRLSKRKALALFGDFNFNLMPSIINFKVDVDRLYAENTLRENSPDNFLPVGTFFNKNFSMSRLYGISWNLTKSLKLDFNATNYSIIDEPVGKIDAIKRDTLWTNFWRLGRNTDYNHMINLNYTLPINKIPGLDWVNVVARYGSQFNWQTEPLFLMNDPDVSLGNTVQNSRTIQVNPTFNFISLYRKIGLLNTQDDANIFLKLLTSLKNVNAAYTRTDGIFLPGYLPGTNLFGYDLNLNAPGWRFVLGDQSDIRNEASQKGWITNDPTQNQLYATSLNEDISIRGNIEPFQDLQIEVTATRIKSENYSTTFRYFSETNSFESLTPSLNGMYTISFFSLSTAFKDDDVLYQSFEKAKEVISSRLGSLNPNSNGNAGAFADGYGPAAQDVVVGAFLSVYSGKNRTKQSFKSFPSIPIPSWRINYNGLSRLEFFEEIFSSVNITHGYRSQYTVNNYQSIARNKLVDGYSSVRDRNDNFLPTFQFMQVSIQEEFSPLIGADVRFKNNVSANIEYRKSRALNLSLQNSQLAQLNDKAFVLGMGYRINGFRMPFGMFGGTKLENDLNFKLDVSMNDMIMKVYRADADVSEIASGNKTITVRPSIDYLINNRFSVRMFYDSNAVKPYTSQTYATTNTNFGLNLRVFLQ